MQTRYSGANEAMRLALARVSPGTPLRDGIDRIVRAKAGAHDAVDAVTQRCTGRDPCQGEAHHLVGTAVAALHGLSVDDETVWRRAAKVA